MSRETVIAKRYAKALFEVAKQQNGVAGVEQELKLVADSIAKDPQIVAFLSYPNIESEKKVALIKQALQGKISQDVLNTLELLIERGRQDAIGSVYDAYTKIAGEALGQAHATVYTAKPLDTEEMNKIASRFSAIVGKMIVAEQVVDPSLLGGIKVRIGDRLYDGSLSGKLERLEKAIKS
ncbi:F0F1 ATP synthase subunit delta [Paenibacillus sambharensis]|uniref:ATP synthase subunit delta n=1 Tax=Paenibacillus sambharensis TaxID=1803190 RepID=A0A2W1LTE1_9BACL|nr:F0F1 ATP synthase subunit delta [Paenibacillus sambharensis]PZD97784.1 F0F1 ATP synthase subunit delta [Paenibacillus sambharensis]